MRKVLYSLVCLFLYQTVFAQGNWCGTDLIQQQLRDANPGYDEHLHKSMLKAASGTTGEEKSILYIPVVVHIIHDNGVGNISNAQVEDALRILNEDYNRLNPDAVDTRNTATAPFAPVAGDMKVEFKLAKIDPDGNCTNGILRVNAPHLTYNANDDCKYTSNGGSDQWPMNKYLNIWVVNSINSDGAAGTILGYAYLPYWPNGANYGILIRNDSFGTIGTAQSSDGRTLTHEMGHLLGLQHIFDGGGSGSCDGTDCSANGDYCCDTPPQLEANWSCSAIWNSCNFVPINDPFGFDVVDQIENYMSYNACQNMFSMDQVNIMQQNFIDISFMANMVTANNLIATGINDPDVLCTAEFDAYRKVLCSNQIAEFVDYSFAGPTSWNWNISPGVEGTDYLFVGGTNATSQNPKIQFITQGLYTITLVASDGTASDTEVKSNFITVLPSYYSVPFWEGFEAYSSFVNVPNWIIDNPGNNAKYEVFIGTGSSGDKCAVLNNFGQQGANIDDLTSAPIDLSVVDPATEHVTLSFRYSYRKRNANTDEWLKVFISGDCGDNWVQRKTIHGDLLSPNSSSFAWVPSSSADWTTVHMINVTSGYFTENFRMRFRFEGNNGNNFYLDDINLYKGDPSDNLVLGLAEEGSLSELSIYPNPADEQINIRFSIATDEIVLLEIQDVAGKTVKIERIQANTGSNMVMMDISDLAQGMYHARLKLGATIQALPFVIK